MERATAARRLTITQTPVHTWGWKLTASNGTPLARSYADFTRRDKARASCAALLSQEHPIDVRFEPFGVDYVEDAGRLHPGIQHH